MKLNNKFCLLMIFILILSFVNMASVSALNLVVRVPEKYTDVKAGDRFYFEIEVKYPENPQRKDLRLEYEILTDEGDLLAQSKALKAVETQASFIDFIVIPESAKSGLHFINVHVKDYELLSEEVSASFHVEGGGMGDFRLYLIIIIAVLLLVAVLVVINILVSKRGNVPV